MSRVHELYGRYRALRQLARAEWRSPQRLRHVELWPRGFLSERHELYDFDANDPSLYVSDFARVAHGRKVNDWRFLAVLRNKLVFHEVLERRSFGAYLPRVLGVISDGSVYQTDGEEAGAATTLLELLERCGAMVIRPLEGGGGNGIHVLRLTPSGPTHNGRALDAAAVDVVQRSCGGHLATELLEQHPYGARIFPGVLHTMRVPTMRDVETGAPFIPIAIHRFANAASAPVDNFSRGGLSANIDLATGELGPAASLTPDGSVRWHERHPETGAEIAGVRVPGWDDVQRLVLDVAAAFPYLRCVGWDVAVTEDGPKLIEGNYYMGVAVLQLHGPLLADERVRSFYERTGVVSKRFRAESVLRRR